MAPLYRRGDSVYLRGSAEIGKLEAFRITTIKQVQDGRWLYGITIDKKPPDHALIGDSFDARIKEPALYYTDAELMSACEALDIITTRFATQITALENAIASRCAEDEPSPSLDEPRWNIGDVVYFDASAKVGFLERTKISEIYEVGIQPGSRRTKYKYRVDSIKPTLYFREDELISYCEAANKALLVLRRDLSSAEAKRTELCPGI